MVCVTAAVPLSIILLKNNAMIRGAALALSGNNAKVLGGNLLSAAITDSAATCDPAAAEAAAAVGDPVSATAPPKRVVAPLLGYGGAWKVRFHPQG